MSRAKAISTLICELSLQAFSHVMLNVWESSRCLCPISLIWTSDLCGCCCRYIKTSGNATVDHLSKYLAVRLALEELRSKGESNQMNLDTASEKQYTIYIATANGQFTVSGSSKRKTEHQYVSDTDTIRIHAVGLFLSWHRDTIHGTRLLIQKQIICFVVKCM